MRARTVLLALFCVSLMVMTSLVCIADDRGSDTVCSDDGDSDDGCDDNGKTKFYVDHIKYIVNSDGKTVRVDGQDFGQGYPSITIPNSVDYNGKTYLVTEIARDAFHFEVKTHSHYCPRSVIVGDNVEVIHAGAFMKNKSDSRPECLENITFGDNSKLRVIEMSAFYNTRISSIELPASIEKIGESAFSDCHKLKSVKIHSPINHGFHIEDEAFLGCYNLESINLENATLIGKQAFFCCYKLTDLDLSSVSWIYKEAFDTCKIEHVTFGNSFIHVSGSSFSVQFFDANGNKISVGDPNIDKLKGKEFKLIDGKLREVVHINDMLTF